jgi:hypothetical protein
MHWWNMLRGLTDTRESCRQVISLAAPPSPSGDPQLGMLRVLCSEYLAEAMAMCRDNFTIRLRLVPEE